MLSPQARRSDSNLVASEGAGTGGSSGKGGLGWRMVSLVLLAWILLFGPFVSSVSKILFVPGEVGTSNIDRAVRRTRSVESNLTIYTRCYHYPTCRPIRCPVALIYRSSCPYSPIPLFPYSPFFPLSISSCFRFLSPCAPCLCWLSAIVAWVILRFAQIQISLVQLILLATTPTPRLGKSTSLLSAMTACAAILFGWCIALVN